MRQWELEDLWIAEDKLKEAMDLLNTGRVDKGKALVISAYVDIQVLISSAEKSIKPKTINKDLGNDKRSN